MSKQQKALLLVFAIFVLLAGIYKLQPYFQSSGEQFNTPVYVINLDRTADRYTRIEKELLNANVKPIRFSAIDGYQLALVTESGRKIIGNEINNLSDDAELGQNFTQKLRFLYKGQLIDEATFQRYKWHMLMTVGECGIALSHRAVWREIASKEDEYAIVLEDDASIPLDFVKQVQNLLTQLPIDFDLILLHTQAPNYKLEPASHDLYKLIPTNSTIAEIPGYIIKRSSINKLLSLTSNIFLPIDDLIAYNLNQGNISVYKTVNSIVPPDRTIPSEIQRMGRGY